MDHAVWDFTMTEGGKSEIQGEAWVRSMLTLPLPPAGLLFMDGKRAQKYVDCRRRRRRASFAPARASAAPFSRLRAAEMTAAS